MNLVIDIGNSLTKLAVFDAKECIDIQVVEVLSIAAIRTIAEDYDVTTAILSAVKAYPGSIKEYLYEQFYFIELTNETPLPIKNDYETPATLGKDRIALAVGGWSLYPGEHVLLIDAGTCITYDLVSSEGVYAGGAISPGIRMRFQSLNTFTGKLPLIDFKDVDNPIGRSTESCILSGVLYGILNEAAGFIDRFKITYPES